MVCQHSVELEQLRRSQADLEASRARYFELYDLAPVGYATLDDRGIVSEMNLRAEALLGAPRGGWNGRNFKFSILAEDQGIYGLCCKRLLTKGSPQICELRMCRPAGDAFWARLEIGLGETDGGLVFRIVFVDISDLKAPVLRLRESERQLRNRLAEKDTQIKEVHHRVKNNLQVVSSLLRMQAELLNGTMESNALTESQKRIFSMALIHERLYGGDLVDRIDFEEYVHTLVKELFNCYAGSAGLITPCLSTSRVLLSAEEATCCGLILNELVTNALKYAYPGAGSGEVSIALKEDLAGQVTLTVSDGGVGLPAGLDWRNSNSMGLPIVEMLTKQIGGTLMVGGPPGTSFAVAFSKEGAPAPAVARADGKKAKAAKVV